MTASPHWATAWIGQPYDPVTDHCWAFVRRVWRAEFGWDVAELDVDAVDPRQVRRDFAGHPEFGHWSPVEGGLQDAVEGDAVIMARGKRPCHIGIWIAPSHVLHAVAGSGSLATPVGRLADLGYRVHGLYRRVAA